MEKLMALLGASLSLASCRVHPLNNGNFSIGVSSTQRDNCGLVAGAPWTSRVQSIGDDIWLTTNLFGIQLRGLWNTNQPAFTASGDAANVAAVASGVSCEAQFVNVDLTGAVQNANQFIGSLKIQYSQLQTPSACNCQTWVNYQATETP
jgi:hypothetical protein